MTADADAALDADGLVVPGRRRVRRLHGRAARGRAATSSSTSGWPGRAPGARHLRRHAGAVRARASSTACATDGLRGRGRARSSGSTAPVLPHMGWNTVDARPPGSALFAGIGPRDAVLLRALLRAALAPLARGELAAAAPLVTWAEHGEPFVAAVENGPLCATQFHPEKSGDAGAALLANWLETDHGDAAARPCCPPSTSPTARRSGSSRAWPAARPRTATRWRPRWPGSGPAPSGSTWSTWTRRSAAGPTRSCSPRWCGRLDVAVELSGGIRDDDSLAARAGHRLRPGQHRHRGAGEARTGSGRSSPSTASGSRSASTCAGHPAGRPRLDRARAATCYETLDRLDAEGCARYVVTDVTQGRHAARPEPGPAPRRLRPHRPRR